MCDSLQPHGLKHACGSSQSFTISQGWRQLEGVCDWDASVPAGRETALPPPMPSFHGGDGGLWGLLRQGRLLLKGGASFPAKRRCSAVPQQAGEGRARGWRGHLDRGKKRAVCALGGEEESRRATRRKAKPREGGHCEGLIVHPAPQASQEEAKSFLLCVGRLRWQERGWGGEMGERRTEHRQ